jgi:hypothetical protein
MNSKTAKLIGKYAALTGNNKRRMKKDYNLLPKRERAAWKSGVREQLRVEAAANMRLVTDEVTA